MTDIFRNEKDIQNNILNFLINNGISPIEDEDGWLYENLKQEYSFCSTYSLSSKWYHDYIIAKDFTDAIVRLNPELFYHFSHLLQDNILDVIWNDFTEKYDRCHNNVEIYNLFFNTELSILLNDKNGYPISYPYRILDNNLLNECNRNYIRVIKEKTLHIEDTLNDVQRPDFAVYCNGLPFIVVEVKNPMLTLGLRDAYKDYCQKAVYYKFLIGLCTDGKKASLVSSTNNSSLDIWKNYGSNKKNDDENGLYDFIKEIICNSRNMMILFTYGIFNIKKNQLDCLSTARVQQYFAMKKVLNMLIANKNANNNIEPFRYLIKHPPRSGKTITSRSIVHLITDLFSIDFDKIFIQLPDKIITEQFLNDFNKFTFGNNYPIHEIERRLKNDKGDFSYEDAVKSNSRGIYIMNMQKIDEIKIKETTERNTSSKVLFILDEVHTHQLANMAEERYAQFPYASYITFTATPRIKQGIDMSLSNYSTISEYLDELTNEDARNIDIVLPVFYKKLGYDMIYDKDNLNVFSEKVFNVLNDILKNKPEKMEQIKEKVKREIKDKNNEGADIKKYEIYKEELLKYTKIGDATNTMANALIAQVNKSIMMSKINFIIAFMKNKKQQDYSSLKKAKAFFVVNSQDEANFIMKILDDNPYYDGYRFGIDYSTINNEQLIQFNKVNQYSDIIKSFSSDDDDSIDILIVVEKYLKGYNNPKLCYVFCDCQINEPSKLFQIFTRPGTKMPGKKHGYFIDMSLSNVNYETFEKALEYYEEHEKIYSILLTDEKIEKLRKELKSIIDAIVKIANYNDLKDFRLAVRTYKQDIFINLSQEIQGKIIKQCYLLNNILKQLGCCSNYGVDNYIDILSILKGVGKIIHRNKHEKLISISEAEYLCRSIMDNLHIKNYQDIINIDIGDLYDRPRDINSNVAQFLKQELKINLDSGEQPVFSGNLSEKVENKKTAIEEANWGAENNTNTEHNVVKEWVGVFQQFNPNVPDYDLNPKIFDYIYNTLKNSIETNIKNNNIKHNFEIAESVLNKIRSELITDLRTSEFNNKITLISLFFDKQRQTVNTMIKNIIINQYNYIA